MEVKKSLGGSIKLNLKHKLQLNPSEKEVSDKPVRGSDVPLFKVKGRASLGMQIKTIYNKCMNLSAHRPSSGTPVDETLIKKLDKQEGLAIKQMKHLKKKKKDYSQAWKDNFSKYKYKKTVAYNDEDPFDDTWMNHPILEESEEMQVAGEKYLDVAEEVAIALTKVFDDIAAALETLLITHESSLDDWAKGGEAQVKNQLTEIQKQVDVILASEWGPIKPYLVGEFKGITPSYIGSTNTGQKSITKAYIQFNPKDYDVDGQLISTDLYVALAQFGAKVSKERIFVRVAAQPTIVLIEKKLKEELEEEEIIYLTNFKDLLTALDEYVARVEAKLITLDGIQEDLSDCFDLAIVKKQLES
jgi:hypothetical protein